MEHILIVAFITLGYCCIFWEGMIFQNIGDWMECNVPEWLWKPLGGCYICACMWIGSIVYLIINSDSIHTHTVSYNIKDWLLTCIGAMGVNAAISQFVDRRHTIDIASTPTTIEYNVNPDGTTGTPWNMNVNQIVSNDSERKSN